MSGYLTNLAARALGVSEVARPRQSLFEPRRGIEPLQAAAEPGGLEAQPAAEALSGQALRPPPRVKPIEPAPQSRERERPSAPAGDRGPPPVPQPSPTPRQAHRRTRPVLPEPPPPPAARKKTGPPAPGPPEPPAPEEEAPVVPESRPLAAPTAPLLRPARLPQRVLPPTQPPEPTVRVTIGRIDVRAVKADEPPKPRRKPRPAPRMSLDEYLARSAK